MVWLLVTAAGCTGGSEGLTGTGGHSGNGTGGGPGSGGSSGSGTGGATGTGGASGMGGASGTDGTRATGGGPGTGGAGTGGANGTGGSRATGGGPGTGGGSSGGASAAGGTTGAGGMSGKGGAQTTGGANGTGGATGTGGTQGTGGATGGRGGSGAGGTAGTGGTAGDGGVRPDGPDGAPDGGDAGTAYNPCPATAGTACAVLPLGDSITEGCCTQPMGGYRIELFRQAVRNNKNLTYVGTLTNGPTTVENKPFPRQHEGHGGYTISQIAGLADNAISTSKPHIVILKIGTNDINGNVDVANAPNRLESLINQIIKDAPSALLVVSAIIPTTTDGTNQGVQTYNSAIKVKVDNAVAAGKHVVFVDNYKAFTQNSSYKTALMADNLHPNDAGYVVLGQSFYGVIGSLLPAAP